MHLADRVSSVHLLCAKARLPLSNPIQDRRRTRPGRSDPAFSPSMVTRCRSKKRKITTDRASLNFEPVTGDAVP